MTVNRIADYLGGELAVMDAGIAINQNAPTIEEQRIQVLRETSAMLAKLDLHNLECVAKFTNLVSEAGPDASVSSLVFVTLNGLKQ